MSTVGERDDEMDQDMRMGSPRGAADPESEVDEHERVNDEHERVNEEHEYPAAEERDDPVGAEHVGAGHAGAEHVGAGYADAGHGIREPEAAEARTDEPETRTPAEMDDPAARERYLREPEAGEHEIDEPETGVGPAAAVEPSAAETETEAGAAVPVTASPVGASPMAAYPTATEPAPHDAVLITPDESARFYEQIHQIQGMFVDDPRKSVRDAEHLLEDIVQSLASGLEQRRRALTSVTQEDGTGTEELRQALRSYRSLAAQLLGPESSAEY